MNDPTPRQVSNATTDKLIAEMRSTNPWAVIDEQAKRIAWQDSQIDALRKEIVRLIGELDAAKKQLTNHPGAADTRA